MIVVHAQGADNKRNLHAFWRWSTKSPWMNWASLIGSGCKQVPRIDVNIAYDHGLHDCTRGRSRVHAVHARRLYDRASYVGWVPMICELRL